MIAGWPIATWLLLIAAVGAGLALELIFYFNHRGAKSESADGAAEQD